MYVPVSATSQLLPPSVYLVDYGKGACQLMACLVA